MTDVLTKRKNLDTDMYRGRIPCENEDTDLDDAFTSQRRPVVRNYMKSMEKILSHSPERTNSADTLILDF